MKWLLAPFLIAALSMGAVAAEVSPLVVETASGARHAFKVEVAATSAERAQGLMYRRWLDADAGMLFDFGAPQVVRMWMRNTHLSLDMLFIAADGALLGVAERTVPLSEAIIASPPATRYVLEVVAGTVARLGLKAGDRVRHGILGNLP